MPAGDEPGRHLKVGILHLHLTHKETMALRDRVTLSVPAAIWTKDANSGLPNTNAPWLSGT
jgi:hypothetical protein